MFTLVMVFCFLLAQNPWSELVGSALGTLWEYILFSFVQNVSSISALILLCSPNWSMRSIRRLPESHALEANRSTNIDTLFAFLCLHRTVRASYGSCACQRGLPVGSTEDAFLMVESVWKGTAWWTVLVHFVRLMWVRACPSNLQILWKVPEEAWGIPFVKLLLS